MLTPLQVLKRFRAHDGTLTDFLASRVERDPDAEAVVAADRSWSWREIEGASLILAGHLAARGIGPAKRVVVMGRNSVWHVLVLLATARLGALFVPTNPDFKTDEAAYVFRHSSADAVLCDDEARPVAEAALAQVGSQAWLGRLDESLLPASLTPFAALPAPSADAPCLVIYTSGSTGFPKGAVHSQRTLVTAGEVFVERMRLQPEDRLMLILPMFHINALFYSVAGSLAAGGALLIESRFSASRFWRRVAELRATEVNIIEAIGNILLTRPAEEFVPGTPLAKVYGVRDTLVARFRERFGVPHLIGGYAMTEIPGLLSTPFDSPNRPGSMGVMGRHPDGRSPWAECRIVDDERHDLPADTVGELMVRTPLVMQGYLGDEAQTRASFHDDWFLTGDLVRRDADGFFFFVSRKKDIIRRRGENVAGLEIDRVVGAHPGIVVAAAIGVPSPFGEEDILVAATRSGPAAVSEAELLEWCRARLAPTKLPRYIVFLDQMPLTPTHKVLKADLRKDTSLVRRAVDFG